MSARLDHMMVLADTLAQGVAWCEATLGVVPAPGGQHPLFGTHNRLLALGGAAFAQAYLEIIAIDPAAGDPGRTRWFDMDDQRLRRQVRAQGPQLIHWVARVPELARAAAAWAALGLERGAVLPASRMTPRGLLEWQITVREDGQRLLDGCLPTLIQWGAVHPADALPASGIALESLSLRHPQAALLRAALDAVGLAGVAVEPGPAALQARLATPRGAVTLAGFS
ncbi:MAG: VOC family protein [Ottowia sp.]|nr:MAG: VOC family protein [Ottowia sp.]HOZ94381.1 VOC family protein [Ottowia sp.]HQQ53511.1 VOC family protein [Ottowia sp.]